MFKRSLKRLNWAVAGLGLVLAVAGAGCGSGKTETSLGGVVKLDDKPMPGGEVILYPQEGSDTTERHTGISPDGKYTFLVIPVGAVKFAVKGPGKPSSPTDPPVTVVVPAKYAEKDQSGLSFTVKEGANTYDILLRSAP